MTNQQRTIHQPQQAANVLPPHILSRQSGNRIIIYDAASNIDILCFVPNQYALREDNVKVMKALIRQCVNYANTVHARINNIR